MPQAFNMELRPQQEWSWLVAIDLFLGGVGGGLFLLYWTFDLPPYLALLSLALVALGGVVLLAELGHPMRAWRAICRPRTSWISRGVIFVSVFLIAGLLHTAPQFTKWSALAWAGENPGAKFIGFLAGLCAFIVTVYPGLVLAANRAIPFWNTTFAPLLFFTQSLGAASGVVLLTSRYGSLAVLTRMQPVSSALIVLNAILISIYLLTMNRGSSAARESVRLLKQGSLGATFRAGVVMAGMIVPFALLAASQSLAPVAGAFLLAGGLLFRYCVLKAGVYVPSALVGMDMSKLNRTDAGFAQEYAAMMARRAG